MYMDYIQYEDVILSAEDAYEETKLAIANNISKEIESIIDDIREAITNCKTYISKDGVLSAETKELLKKKHYKVEIDSQYSEPYYTISWDKPEESPAL